MPPKKTDTDTDTADTTDTTPVAAGNAAPINATTNSSSNNNNPGTGQGGQASGEQGTRREMSLPAHEENEKAEAPQDTARASVERMTSQLIAALGLSRDVAEQAAFAAGNIAEAVGSTGLNVAKIAQDAIIKTTGYDLVNLPSQLAQRAQQQVTSIIP